MLECGHNRGETMSFDRQNQKLKDREIESIEIAVSEAGIRAIHPDKMEDFAEALVQRLKEKYGN